MKRDITDQVTGSGERIYTIVGGSGAGRVGLTGERVISGVPGGVATGEAAQVGGNKSEHLMWLASLRRRTWLASVSTL